MRQLIELLGLVGAGAYQRGQEYARQHRATVTEFDPVEGWVAGTVRGTGEVYRTNAYYTLSRNGVLQEFDGVCTCPVRMDCKHSVALLITALDQHSIAEGASGFARERERPRWRQVLEQALPTPEQAEVALALAVRVTPPGQVGRFGYGFKNGRVTIRPVRSGKRTRWVQSGITWPVIRSGRLDGADQRQLDALERLRRLATADDRYYADPNELELDQVTLAELWPALREVVASGVALVDPHAVGQGARGDAPPVVLEETPAHADLSVVVNDDGDLMLEATLTHERIVENGPAVLVGDQPHGVVWVDADGTHLAPLAQPATRTWSALRESGPTLVPAAEREQFEREFAPRLATHGWRSPDHSYEPPPPPVPRLHLGVRIVERGDPSTPPQVVLGWGWVYGDGDPPAATWLPLTDPRFPAGPGRDGAAEREVLTGVVDILAAPDALPELVLRPGDQLVGEATLNGMAVVRLLELLPELAEAGVRIHHDELPEYRQSEAPSVTIAVAKESRDWFELEVAMEVAGHQVPIGQVIAALAGGQRTLFLPDGSYVDLNLPELEQLRQLIAESRALGDGRRAALRVPRINESWWEELLALGVVQAAEHAWLEAVRARALRSRGTSQASRGSSQGVGGSSQHDDDPPPPVPAGLRATLRPYQREGFEWLATLRRSGLGGVLADDMGLGKTVQTLAMILDERENPTPVDEDGDEVAVSVAVGDDVAVADGVGDDDGGVPAGQAASRTLSNALRTTSDPLRTTSGSLRSTSDPLRTTSGSLRSTSDPLRTTSGSLRTASDRLRSTSRGPWLVVAPTSVVPNWAAEAERFTPDLRVAVVSATAARRTETLAELAADADILVTSYALLRLESEEYQALDLAGLVLDEAQNVKNYTSKAFASARRLGAPVTFAITGTPMENDLTELWAMFALTAPGLLGSPQQFTEVYRRPIERATEDAPALLARLRRRIRPFLLRRAKEQVATDLPPKQEQILRVDLAPGHRRVYDRHLQRERRRILRLADDLEGNRVEVLAALTRLRQLAIDASLVDDDVDVPSSKLDVLVPLLQEAASEGHRVLVFSQFTRYLKLIAQRLDEAGLGYSYLDGATTRRASVIQGFAEGTDPVFLISLKAGGVGLNLTMADYAILADPWWNPAAEAQAVDRTHRIGQERPVMVYRLVATNTIEERVMALQEAKRALVAGVLAEDGAEVTGQSAGRGAGKLSAEDLRSLLA